MNKIKVIDLLNMISKGEEVPKHIKTGKNEWYFYKTKNTYGDKKGGWINWDWFVEANKLNANVEIIEEDKKIEKLSDFYEEQINENGSMSEPFNKHELKIISKINEIIDKLNEMSDKE